MDLGLSPDELALQARAREFAQSVARPRAGAIDGDEQYPWDIVTALSDAGFCAMAIPQAYGGQGDALQLFGARGYASRALSDAAE